MASYAKKSKGSDPSYKRRKSNAPDTQLFYPVCRTEPTAPGVNMKVDGPRLLGSNGHRLYRQCGNYRMKIDLLDSAETPVVRVFALANHWFVKRAIQTARDVHDTAMAEERALTGQSRWYDFRIDDNTGAESLLHCAASTAFGSPTAIPMAGEAPVSLIEDVAGTPRSFVLQGAGATNYQIFAEYDKLGNTANDPVLASTGGYDGAVATIESENSANLQEFGNTPPYNSTNLLDQVFVEVGTLYRQPSGAQRLSTGFFDAPLGLVFLQYASTGLNPGLAVEFASGKYKGVRMEAY